MEMAPGIHSLDHLVLTVDDIGRTVAFYGEVLGMQIVRFRPKDGTLRYALKFGAQKINLHLSGAEFEPKSSKPQPGSADLCFLSDTPLVEWIQHLNGHEIEIEEGPVARTGATGPINSIYVRDPDGNLIEIANHGI